MVRPPCARSSAWNIRTIVPKTAVTNGPKNEADRPVPVGCEQLPVTEGILSADNTKTNAPQTAIRGRTF